MTNPLRLWNAWCAVSLQAAQLAWEAQGVIALRMMRAAAQGAPSRSEGHRMVTEKMAAVAKAQAAAAAAAVTGKPGHHVTKKILGVYKKRVRANRRRLTR